jgi:predicted RNase H-like HicB family nuclease
MKSYIALVRTTGLEARITIPDLPGLEGTGPNIEDARKNVSRALGGHLQKLIEYGGSVPVPSSLMEIISDPQWNPGSVDAIILAVRPTAR